VRAGEEEDDGFRFTRSKRAKATAAAAVIAAPPQTKKSTTAVTGRRDGNETMNEPPPKRRKMSFSIPSEVQSDNTKTHQLRRSARLSTESEPKVERRVKSVTKRKRVSSKSELEESTSDGIQLIEDSGASFTPTRENTCSDPKAVQISLPFSDTPVINRNKEFRMAKGGRRRSSLGIRGRRASDLFDHGHSAIPHSEVESAHFYKHIDPESLSEPKRMKQLMAWCAERALGPKHEHNDPDSIALLSGECRFSFSYLL
jgi:kinetochore protein Mis13/DSN1